MEVASWLLIGGKNMKSAVSPRNYLDEKLLLIDSKQNKLSDHRIVEFANFFAAGDLLVLNDAATLPASLTTQDCQWELRLLQYIDGSYWKVLLFSKGDWRSRTEDRV